MAVDFRDKVVRGLPKHLIKRFADKGMHIAVMKEPYYSLLINGEKTLESRFSLNKISPYKKVQVGDLIVLKRGKICSAFCVSSVEYHELSKGDINVLKAKHNEKIRADEAFWNVKEKSRYASLVGVGEIFMFPGIDIEKSDRRGWVTI